MVNIVSGEVGHAEFEFQRDHIAYKILAMKYACGGVAGSA